VFGLPKVLVGSRMGLASNKFDAPYNINWVGNRNAHLIFATLLRTNNATCGRVCVASISKGTPQ
jgi:hypothetical protein